LHRAFCSRTRISKAFDKAFRKKRKLLGISGSFKESSEMIG